MQVVFRFREARVFLQPSPAYEQPRIDPDEFVLVDANGAVKQRQGREREAER